MYAINPLLFLNEIVATIHNHLIVILLKVLENNNFLLTMVIIYNYQINNVKFIIY